MAHHRRGRGVGVDVGVGGVMWQPIETAPRDTPILVWGGHWSGEINMSEPYDHPMVVTTSNGHSWDVCGTDAYAAWIVNPTHWQPLPEPPKEEI